MWVKLETYLDGHKLAPNDLVFYFWQTSLCKQSTGQAIAPSWQGHQQVVPSSLPLEVSLELWMPQKQHSESHILQRLTACEVSKGSIQSTEGYVTQLVPQNFSAFIKPLEASVTTYSHSLYTMSFYIQEIKLELKNNHIQNLGNN